MNSRRAGAADGNDGKNGNHASHHSHSSHSAKPEPERVLVPRGDYRFLRSFQKAEVVYDMMTHQANYLIDQQLKTLENEFIEQGGLRERMTRVRLANRHSKRT